MLACIRTLTEMFVQIHAFGGRGSGFEMRHDPVNVPDDCTLADWEFDPDGVPPVHHFEHVAETSFDLPSTLIPKCDKFRASQAVAY